MTTKRPWAIPALMGLSNVSFQAARQYEPRLFEAHVGYGSTSWILGEARAAKAGYQDALRLRPNDYNACMGLARVQDDREGWDRCIALAPSRSEAYFEAARAESKSGGAQDRKRIKSMLESFVSRASSIPSMAGAVREAKAALTSLEGR